MNELEFQRQFKPDGPPTLGDVFARAMLPDRAEQEEARAAKAAAAALAERNEQLALANAMAGNPLAELSRAQSATAAARDVVRDLEARLSEAREVLSRAEGNMAAWSGQVEELQANVARRSSAEIDVLAPAKAAHMEFVSATRAAIAAMEAGKPRQVTRHPFVSRGNAVRSECCTWCTKFEVPDEHSFLLHSDPEKRVPVTPPGTVPQAEQERQVREVREWLDNPETAERRTPGRRYAEISR
jgi:hypothetical protein